jgi:hypothetical protein
VRAEEKCDVMQRVIWLRFWKIKEKAKHLEASVTGWLEIQTGSTQIWTILNRNIINNSNPRSYAFIIFIITNKCKLTL